MKMNINWRNLGLALLTLSGADGLPRLSSSSSDVARSGLRTPPTSEFGYFGSFNPEKHPGEADNSSDTVVLDHPSSALKKRHTYIPFEKMDNFVEAIRPRLPALPEDALRRVARLFLQVVKSNTTTFEDAFIANNVTVHVLPELPAESS